MKKVRKSQAYRDTYGKSWSKCYNELDRYCKNHGLSINIEYKPIREKGSNCSKVWCFTMVHFSGTTDVLIDRIDKYPLSDDEILSELKEIIRERKINQII